MNQKEAKKLAKELIGLPTGEMDDAIYLLSPEDRKKVREAISELFQEHDKDHRNTNNQKSQ